MLNNIKSITFLDAALLQEVDSQEKHFASLSCCENAVQKSLSLPKTVLLQPRSYFFVTFASETEKNLKSKSSNFVPYFQILKLMVL